MTRSLTINYDDDVLTALDMTADEFRAETRVLIAAKLYEMGRLSTGAEAALATCRNLELPRLCRAPHSRASTISMLFLCCGGIELAPPLPTHV